MVNPVNIYVFPEIACAQESQQSSPAFFFSLVPKQLNLAPRILTVQVSQVHPPGSQLQAVAEVKVTSALGTCRKILCLRRCFEDADGV